MAMERKWSYDVLRNLARNKRRFSDFLNEGIPKKSLADTLKALEDEEYLRREVVMSHPITADYYIL